MHFSIFFLLLQVMNHKKPTIAHSKGTTYRFYSWNENCLFTLVFRITDGQPNPIYAFPWHISLHGMTGDQHFKGATNLQYGLKENIPMQSLL